jgi:hypothetical protein
MLIGVPAYLGYAAILGTFTWSLLWLLLVSFAIGVGVPGTRSSGDTEFRGHHT